MTNRSLALDGSGYPHIAYGYIDPSVTSMRNARWTGFNWSIQVITGYIGWGQYCSLVLDNTETPHCQSSHYLAKNAHFFSDTLSVIQCDDARCKDT